MNVKRLIFISIISVCCPLLLQAQFITVDWNEAKGDTVLPLCASVIDLPSDYENNRYSAHIEYPEYQKMSSEEVKRFSLKTKYGILPEEPEIDCHIGVQAKIPQLDVVFLPVVMRGGDYYRINSYKLVVDKTPKPMMRASVENVAKEIYAKSSQLASGRWVRVAVKENGVHKITHSELKNMGFQNPDSVRLFGYGGHMLPETTLKELPDDLQEVPLWRENGYMLFYANGVIKWEYKNSRFVHNRNVYSDYGCYFLTEGGAPLKFVSETFSEKPLTTITSYPDYTVIDNDEYSHCQYGRVLVDSYDYSKGRSVTYNFPISGVAQASGIVDLSFATNGVASSSVEVSIKGTSIGRLDISSCMSGEVGKLDTCRLEAKDCITDNLVVKLTHAPANSSVNGFLDYLRVNYTRKLALRGSQTLFRGGENVESATFEIEGCNANTRVWDISSKVHRELKGILSGNRYSVVATSSPENELVVLDVKGSFPSVQFLGEVPNQNLHALENVDMVIIIPSNCQFLSPATRLANAHRDIDSLEVAVVTAQQVYNEFSSGTPDVTAYRRLMKMLYDRAKTADDAPKYLLMFGDGWYDNRLRTFPNYKQEDYLLCYQSENSVNAVKSYVLEDYMGLLDDSEGEDHKLNKVDLGIGRIPTTSVAVANAVVEKLIAYMKNDNAGAWQNIVALLGDDGDHDMPNQHMKDAEGVAAIIGEKFPSYAVDRIYWDDYVPEKSASGFRYPLVTEAIKSRLDKGALIVNYTGHGSENTLSHELTWSAPDMVALKSPRVPFWVTASCDIGPFDKGDGNIADAALMNPIGGAIGLFTTTRTVLQYYNAVLNKEFIRELLSPVNGGDAVAVGDAVRKAKCNVISKRTDRTENKLQYVLLGDPALRLHLPKYRIRVEKVNGVEPATPQKASAGSVLAVEGCVIARNDSVATDFNGLLYADMFDCAEEVTTRNNAKLGTFEYTAHNKKLSAIVDSVKSGRFSIKMPVPLDISYKNEEGLLNLFAIDSSKVGLAQGHFNNFLIGGTASEGFDDGAGPEIKVYLNTRSFVSGDKVNSTPCLLVDLYDENGINTIGSGIGHDIMAIIDNDPAHTYNLNSVYSSVAGDYKHGTITFPLHSLGEGTHTLMLRAWDLNNNSSVVTVEFTVESDALPEVSNLKLLTMPVMGGEPNTIVVTHNRPQSEIEVTLELCSVHRQLMWKNVEKTVCGGMEYVCSWDATATGNKPLQTGVYILRAYVKCENGVSKSKNLKIVVINNKK